MADGAVVPAARGDGIGPEIADAAVRVPSAVQPTGSVGSADTGAQVAMADSTLRLDQPGRSLGWGR